MSALSRHVDAAVNVVAVVACVPLYIILEQNVMLHHL